MANRIEVIVTEAGAGKRYMASDLKATPTAQAGDLITIRGDAYAAGLIEEGLVVLPEPAVVEPVTAVPDDLTRISGLGKSSAAKLNAAGVNTFTELARVDDAPLLAEATGIAANKIEEWQAAAQTLTEEG